MTQTIEAQPVPTQQRTVIQVPEGDEYVELLALPGVSLAIESGRITVLGERYWVVRRKVEISMGAGYQITTTLSVVPDKDT